MPQKRLNYKPGAGNAPFRPDTIETYSVDCDGTLLEFLIESMPMRKRTNIKELLKHNQIMVNRTVTTQHDYKLHPGDTVRVNLTREFRVFYHRRLQIVYEDDDIIVVNKGYGLLSMGTDRVKDGTAYSILRDYVKWSNPSNKIFIVHRLDRDTSGLMVFAKTEEAKNALQHNWNNMVLERRYVALIEGRFAPENAEGEIRSYLAENSRYEVYSTKNPEEGQLAVTRYRTLRSRNAYSLVELQLETGRKNQIRVHMSDSGHPIAGDRRYGAKSSPIKRLALHAQTLKFAHPITRKLMDFSTPIPISFEKTVR